MSNAKNGQHTPGPWTSDILIVGWLNGQTPGVAVRGPIDSDGVYSPVCMVQPHMSGPYCVAGSKHPIEDARLIAAAPDLLAALKEVMDRHEGYASGMGGCVCAGHMAGRAAIAKAEGTLTTPGSTTGSTEGDPADGGL